MPALTTFSDFGLNGREALFALVKQSAYGSPEQAIASLTCFTHPDTVRQLPRPALFACIRANERGGELRHGLAEHEGRRLWFDDNTLARRVFAWCNNQPAVRTDVQLNHIYESRRDPEAFCALANLCIGPSFLAKLTDNEPRIIAILKRRSFELYGWTPDGVTEPAKPAGYDALVWAAPLAPIADLEGTLRRRMARYPASPATRIAREIGWAFSGGRPDTSFPRPKATSTT